MNDTSGSETLRELIRDHYASVYRYAFRWCRDEDMAAEVTVETFATVLRRPEMVRNRKNQYVWLLGIARNKLREARRRRYAKKRLEALFVDIWPGGMPPTAVPFFSVEPPDANASLTAAQLWPALLKLPVNQREALLLKYAEQLSSEEIAQIMKCSKRTVDRLIDRARRAVFLELQPINTPLEEVAR